VQNSAVWTLPCVLVENTRQRPSLPMVCPTGPKL
jgi:hypothetical protein